MFGLSREEFAELFDTEARRGTTVKIVPEVDHVSEGKEVCVCVELDEKM